MSVLHLFAKQRRGVISHDLQTSLLVLKAKDLPASGCSQVRERVEHHKEEMCKGHLFCPSKIIDQGTQAYKKKNPKHNKHTKRHKNKKHKPKQKHPQSKLMRGEGEQGQRRDISELLALLGKVLQ